MSKVILVAGGCGFIGSHLCKQLLKKNYQVICIDNVTTGRKENIKILLSNATFTFVNGDICTTNVINKFKNKKIDEIYHLASPASVTYVTTHPIETALTNSLGTKNLLDLARAKKAKLLFASSSEAYGNPKQHPQKETYWGNVNSIGARSGYDEGKRFGEALCMAFYREYKTKVSIVRIFNTYGPHSSPTDSRVVPRFIAQALKNKPIPVHGDGSQTRSFCFVDDLVSGLIKMMESNQIGPLNLGNPDEYTIKNVANLIIKLTRSKSKIKFTVRPKDDPSVRKPDISLARKKLKWRPTVSFEEGLMQTVTYFKEHERF